MANKPANRERGEVSLSEAGDGVYLRFTNDAMERLYTEYGDGYVDDVIRKVGAVNPVAFRIILECMVHYPEGSKFDIKERPWGLSWNDLNERILDAIFLALHKRTFKEQQEHLEQEADKAFEKAAKEAKDGNPRKAAALFSKLSAELVQPQDFDQTRSEPTRHRK